MLRQVKSIPCESKTYACREETDCALGLICSQFSCNLNNIFRWTAKSFVERIHIFNPEKYGRASFINMEITKFLPVQIPDFFDLFLLTIN